MQSENDLTHGGILENPTPGFETSFDYQPKSDQEFRFKGGFQRQLQLEKFQDSLIDSILENRSQES